MRGRLFELTITSVKVVAALATVGAANAVIQRCNQPPYLEARKDPKNPMTKSQMRVVNPSWSPIKIQEIKYVHYKDAYSKLGDIFPKLQHPEKYSVNDFIYSKNVPVPIFGSLEVSDISLKDGDKNQFSLPLSERLWIDFFESDIDVEISYKYSPYGIFPERMATITHSLES